jgi:hypothetical protein
MTNKIAVENLVGNGLKAIITDDGEAYTTYSAFALAAGYPEAVNHKEDSELRNGDIVEILAKGNHGTDGNLIYVVRDEDGSKHLISADGLKVLETAPSVKSLKEIVEQLRSCGYTCEAGPLENNVDFQLLERIAGVEHKRTLSESLAAISKAAYGVGTALEAMMTRMTLQQVRDEIVEKAKRDVKHETLEATQSLLRAKFVVNSEKRTVVCLMERFDLGYIAKRGIAKCDPSDCFNVHIGKAIALRRALGLEVPAEYLNAPQPTEVRVGDVVESKRGLIRKVIRFCDGERGNYHGRPFFTGTGWLGVNQVKVIDDSREEVAE